MRRNRELPGINQHLRKLSERIRALRARRGMTRKDLSRDSNISERYLAQLESGEANPSVALLWQIAHALAVDFHDLIDDRGKFPSPAESFGTSCRRSPRPISSSLTNCWRPASATAAPPTAA